MVSQPERLRKKVLLIDSDELVRSSMVSFLDARECELTACETVREGIEALKRKDFDIILCDQSLPNEDCLEFFGLSGSSQPACKRVLLTSPKETAHPADVLHMGVDAVIEKPLTAESVEDCLAQMIEAA